MAVPRSEIGMPSLVAGETENDLDTRKVLAAGQSLGPFSRLPFKLDSNTLKYYILKRLK